MKPTVNLSPIEDDLYLALEEARRNAEQLLGVEILGVQKPAEVIMQMSTFIDELLKIEHSAEVRHSYAISLGALWGELVVQAYGWMWAVIDFGEGESGIYIHSPENYFCTPPLYYMRRIIEGENIGPDGKNANTVAVLFETLDGIDKKTTGKTFQVIA